MSKKKDTLAILLPYAFKRSLSSYSNEVVLVFKVPLWLTPLR